MKLDGISQFNALPKRQQEIELIKERARQTFNDRNISQYRIPTPKTDIGEYLEQRVKRELMWEKVIQRVTRNFKWPKLV